MRNLKTIFPNEEYDLLIIGGGINGAAVAHIAVSQGLSVALVEKEDFASGTSSKSTKLVHGGLRYLEHLEFDLVSQSLHERYIQWKSNPHLVSPLRFVIPVYKGDKRPLWMMKLGVFLYDLLSGKYVVEKHKGLTPQEVANAIPGINRDKLVGGVAYSDCRMDDARLCLENILSARAQGAHVANYVAMTSFLKMSGKVIGANVKDAISGESFTIKAKHVVSCVGPWTNQLLKMDTASAKDKIRMTKGVHLVYRDKISETALFLQAKKDNRVFFILPFGPHALIGTTDTDFYAKPDEVEADREDMDYLLQEAGRHFPDRVFRRENIVTTFAGLRPLVFAKGKPSQISRDHVIEENFTGVIYVMGGKYTTYRLIAKQCVEKVLGRKVDLKGEHKVFGSGFLNTDAADIAGRHGISVETASYLFGKYGSQVEEVLKLAQKDRSLIQPLCSCSLAIKAQVVYSLKTEMAMTPDDIIWRRLGLGYVYCASKQCRRVIEEMCKKA